MKKLKIGISGLGRVASKTHIPVLKKMEGVEVITGVEVNPERAERVKSMFRFSKVYACHDDMCSSDTIDAVYICLPTFLHKEACKKALEHGLHVLCEKPMGMSVAEAEEITALAESKGLVLMPGYKQRYAPNFLKAKKMIDDGLLGKILHVQGTFTNPGPYISWDPKSDWYLDEKWHGVIYDSVCHIVDLLLYLLPLEFGNVRTIANNGFIGYNTPTNITSIFEMEGGISGSITVGWRTATDIFSLAIHGTAGSLAVSRDSFVYLHPGTDPVDRILVHLQNAHAGCSSLMKKVTNKIQGKDFYQEDLMQAETFCRAINKEEKNFINGRDAIKVHNFLEMILNSAQA